MSSSVRLLLLHCFSHSFVLVYLEVMGSTCQSSTFNCCLYRTSAPQSTFSLFIRCRRQYLFNTYRNVISVFISFYSYKSVSQIRHFACYPSMINNFITCFEIKSPEPSRFWQLLHPWSRLPSRKIVWDFHSTITPCPSKSFLSARGKHDHEGGIGPALHKDRWIIILEIPSFSLFLPFQ